MPVLQSDDTLCVQVVQSPARTMSKRPLSGAVANPTPSKQPRLTDVSLWGVEDVCQWAKNRAGVDEEDAGILRKQKITGRHLLELTESRLLLYGVSGAAAMDIMKALHTPGMFVFPLLLAPSLPTRIDFHFVSSCFLVSVLSPSSSIHFTSLSVDDNAIRLWTALRDEKVVKKTLNGITVYTLPDGIRWLTESSGALFSRQCNDDMYEIVSKVIDGALERGVVITGNPGTCISLGLDMIDALRYWEKLVLKLLFDEVCLGENSNCCLRVRGSRQDLGVSI